MDHEGTCETGLDCGFAAFTARQITTTVGPYRSFSNLTVIPYEYGQCSAPVGFTQTAPLESCPPPIFDLTIFGDDDVTPIFGTMDEYGEEITEASFSTWPEHPRPWLRRWTAGSEHEIDPIGGSSNVGALIAEVIDKRVDPCDQGTGILTGAGADGEGFSAYIGRRAVARERLSDGTFNIVHDGPITEVALLDTLVTYQFRIASMPEREREGGASRHAARDDERVPIRSRRRLRVPRERLFVGRRLDSLSGKIESGRIAGQNAGGYLRKIQTRRGKYAGGRDQRSAAQRTRHAGSRMSQVSSACLPAGWSPGNAGREELGPSDAMPLFGNSAGLLRGPVRGGFSLAGDKSKPGVL